VFKVEGIIYDWGTLRRRDGEIVERFKGLAPTKGPVFYSMIHHGANWRINLRRMWMNQTLNVDAGRRSAKPIGRNSFPHFPCQEIAALRFHSGQAQQRRIEGQ